MRLVLVAVLVLGLLSPVFAVTGARQGCLAIFNNSTQAIDVYVQGSSADDIAPWTIPAGVRTLLIGSTGNEGPMLIVSEQTYVCQHRLRSPHSAG